MKERSTTYGNMYFQNRTYTDFIRGSEGIQERKNPYRP